MMKNRKVVVAIVGIAVGIGIIGSLLYGKINMAENEYVSLESSIYGIRDCAMRDKQELLDIQNKILKLNKNKENTINIDEILEEIEKEEYTNGSKLNDYTKQLDKLNEEIDNMIEIYNKDEKMKKDAVITEAMINIEGINNLIDSQMKTYNAEYAPNFNDAIKKFPVNLICKIKGWFEVDKFSSVK